ncbi:uncharacterized protein EI90DRAFT_2483998 [Cantharellus anzutake]|uniref:uncharacterized protein n=1 Tax=Cantharellus anzutake TaxID=1750568 RepID=UPI0019053977|nr:uncharacterized protein EI90DRAFT_2483998 [Cantharellus anzutake]KAF8322317.1 hypothetical protein EI90DRAFT_2483998 [Cantharellus anzutake]
MNYGSPFLNLREGSRLRRQVNAKLNVSINPAAGRSHLLCTASNDLSLKIWDLRKLMLIETRALVEGDDDGSKAKPPPVLEEDHEAATDFLSSKLGRGCILGQIEHKYSVSSDFWDPRGREIVTTCYDDNLRIWDLDTWLSSGEKLKFP